MPTTLVAAAVAALLGLMPAAPAPLRPPVDGPVLARFDATGPYSAGHRGIDLGAVPGTEVRAPAHGRVTFAGTVAGNQSVTIDTGGGRVVHLSYLHGLAVGAGDVVAAGSVVGWTGGGHIRGSIRGPSVHLGVEIGGEYTDPLPLLARRRAVLVR